MTVLKKDRRGNAAEPSNMSTSAKWRGRDTGSLSLQATTLSAAPGDVDTAGAKVFKEHLGRAQWRKVRLWL